MLGPRPYVDGPSNKPCKKTVIIIIKRVEEIHAVNVLLILQNVNGQIDANVRVVVVVVVVDYTLLEYYLLLRIAHRSNLTR